MGELCHEKLMRMTINAALSRFFHFSLQTLLDYKVCFLVWIFLKDFDCRVICIAFPTVPSIMLHTIALQIIVEWAKV